MKESELDSQQDIHFFRLMLLMSLIIHVFLFVFFVLLEIPLLYIFNVISVLLYLCLICCIRRFYDNEHWLVVPFLEVAMHVVLCNFLMGWGYGFSLYGLMIIPVTYYISSFNPKIRRDIEGSTALAIIALVVIAISCVGTGDINKLPSITSSQQRNIFCVNLILCMSAVTVYSAHFIIRMKVATQMLKERNDELNFMANYDIVTHMRNRQSMQEVFDEYENCDKKFCLVLMDLDDFKEKNDTYGHLCGDEILVNLSYLVRQQLRNRGEVCRWGGDEILLLLKMDEKAGYQLAESMRREIQKFVIDYEEIQIHMTATFGFAFCDESEQIEELLALADVRLHEGKKKGKNQVVRKTT